MIAGLKAAVTIGVVFEIKNRRLGRTWRGEFDTTCEKIVRDGYTISSMWSDTDTQVLMFRVKSSAKSIIGSENARWMVGMLPKLREAAVEKLKGGQSQIRDLLNSLNNSEIMVFARMSAMSGALGHLDAMRCRLPAILDTKDEFGMTPIAWGCAFGQEAILDYARSYETDMASINKYGWGFSDIAKANGHHTLLPKLITMGSPQAEAVLINRMRDCGISFKPNG